MQRCCFRMEPFLSTPSARRATSRWAGLCTTCCYFYPRPPRGGRPPLTMPQYEVWAISIHALREEGDQRHQPCHHAGGISIHALREEGDSPHFFVLVARRVFLSTPSVRRATEPRMGNQQPPAISIHALREEGDLCRAEKLRPYLHISIHALREEGDRKPGSRCIRLSWNFYPRPPRGGRRGDLADAFPQIMEFLSTPSAGRATP